MERRFNDTDWQTSMSNGSIKTNMSSSTVSDTKSLASKAVGDEFEVTSNEKDRLIRDLESEVEQQRQLRLADAKQVEAKAARIKVCNSCRHTRNHKNSAYENILMVKITH